MIIQSKNVYVSGVFAACQIEVCDGQIVQIYPYGTKEVDADYGEDRVIPGMIDVHCHGGLGFDTKEVKIEL